MFNPKPINISSQEILAMLNQKGVSLTQLSQQHRFNVADIMHVINATKCYPNIARIVANSLNATPDMLWPSLFPLPVVQPSTSVFVLRVTLP